MTSETLYVKSLPTPWLNMIQNGSKRLYIV